MSKRGHGGLYQALTKEKETKRRGDKIKFFAPRFEGGQVVGFGEGRRRQDVP